MRILAALLLLLTAFGMPDGAVAETLHHPSGFALTVGAGRTAEVTGRGFLIGLPDNAQRRDPVVIAIEVGTEPRPWLLWPCGPDVSRYRCQTAREHAEGSSGDRVTLTVYAEFGETTVRFRQTKYAEGGDRAVFELLLWLETGELKLERAQ